jgi:HSP20 family protein
MANLTRWNPFREMMTLRNEIDRLFAESVEWPTQERGVAAGLALDLSEQEDAYIVEASTPGIAPEDLDIHITDNVLTIQGEFKQETDEEQKTWHLRERRYGRFSRSLRLPMQVNADEVTAEYNDGVLTLTVPKAEEALPKRITVKVGESGHRVIEGETA